MAPRLGVGICTRRLTRTGRTTTSIHTLRLIRSRHERFFPLGARVNNPNPRFWHDVASPGHKFLSSNGQRTAKPPTPRIFASERGDGTRRDGTRPFDLAGSYKSHWWSILPRPDLARRYCGNPISDFCFPSCSEWDLICRISIRLRLSALGRYLDAGASAPDTTGPTILHEFQWQVQQHRHQADASPDIAHEPDASPYLQCLRLDSARDYCCFSPA